VQGTLAAQFAAGTTSSVASERQAADFALALHPVTDTMLPIGGKQLICNAMTIVTTHYLYKRPPRKRKPTQEHA
jgi:hypothetical protein